MSCEPTSLFETRRIQERISHCHLQQTTFVFEIKNDRFFIIIFCYFNRADIGQQSRPARRQRISTMTKLEKRTTLREFLYEASNT